MAIEDFDFFRRAINNNFEFHYIDQVLTTYYKQNSNLGSSKHMFKAELDHIKRILNELPFELRFIKKDIEKILFQNFITKCIYNLKIKHLCLLYCNFIFRPSLYRSTLTIGYFIYNRIRKLINLRRFSNN